MPRPMPKADVAAFYDRLRTIDPEPKGELDYVNPYTLLVAVALSKHQPHQSLAARKEQAPIRAAVFVVEVIAIHGVICRCHGRNCNTTGV